MRILYITNGFPFPLTSGYLRHYYLLRELAARHRITLLSLVRPSYRPEHAQALAPWVEHVETFAPHHANGRKTMWRRLRPGAYARSPGVKMAAAVRRLLRERDFDAVLFSGKQTFPALGSLGDLPLVADMCDATSLRIQSTARYSPLSRQPLLWAKYFQLRHVERTLVRKASALLFASVRDRQAVLGSGARRGVVVPNGVDLDLFRRTTPYRATRTIVFTGAMDYPPNADAAQYLIEKIFPLVRQRVPDARLLIVGRDPGPRLIAARRVPGVTITGLVDNVRAYLEEAAVFAAPLRFGAGIQNKLLEALAMQVPSVASSCAADGLRTEQGGAPPLVVADGAKPFADALVNQLTADASESTDHDRLRQFVEQNFDWQKSGQLVEQALQSVTGLSPSSTLLAMNP